MTEKFTSTVKFYDDCDTPRWFLPVPKKFSQMYKPMANNFGFIAITARIGEHKWPTSLLPSGDGTHCMMLPKKAREANDIKHGDKVTIEFELRERTK